MTITSKKPPTLLFKNDKYAEDVYLLVCGLVSFCLQF